MFSTIASLSTIVRSELQHFLRLTRSARSLTASILLYQLADISIFIFAYAFLFQSSQDFSTVVWFNLGFYCTLSIGYLLTGQLLKLFSLRSISIVGLLGQAAVLSSIFFFPFTLSPFVVFAVGLLLGIPMGLYWSCRLFLFTIEVPSKQRNYVSGVTNSAHSFFQIIVPALIGWFIATVAPEIGVSKLLAYQTVAVLAALFFSASGFSLNTHSSVSPKIESFRIRKITSQWNWFRAFIFLGSIQFTVTIAVPESLVIGFVGNEAVLGLVSSATQLIAGLSLYAIGRVARPTHRSRILFFSTLPLLLGSILLLFTFSNTTILLYLLGLSIFDSFYWFIYFPVLSDIVDTQTHGSPELSYPYFVDHELWINAGRIITSLAFLWILNSVEQVFAVRIALILAAASQLGLLLVSRKITTGIQPSTLVDEPLSFK